MTCTEAKMVKLAMVRALKVRPKAMLSSGKREAVTLHWIRKLRRLMCTN